MDPKFKSGSHDHNHRHLGVVCHPKPVLATSYLQYVFKDCLFSNPKNMKEEPKCKNKGD